MKRNVQILKFNKVIILTYVFNILLYLFGFNLVESVNKCLFIIGIVYYFISFIIIIYLCNIYSYKNKSRKQELYIYKKSKIFKLEIITGIFSITFYIYSFIIYIISLSNYSLFNILLYMFLIIIFPIFILYFIIVEFSNYIGLSYSWINRFEQINDLINYLDGNKEYLNSNIVLYEDSNNMINNYFDESSLDLEYEKNRRILEKKNISIHNFIDIFFNDENFKNTGHSNIMYLNKKEDLDLLKDKFKNINVEEKIRPYIVFYINTISKDKNIDEEIYKFKDKCEKDYNDLNIRHMLVVNDNNNYSLPNNLKYINYLYICNKDDFIKKVEEICLFSKFIDNSYLGIDSNLYNSSNGYNLFKSAYLTNSKYEELLLLFNYMIYNTEIIAYYIYVKNTSNDINMDIISDNYDYLFQLILDNTIKDDYIYQKINMKIKITNRVKVLLKDKMEYLLDVEFKNEKDELYLSFAGLGDLLTLLRNKIQSHGNINENNIDDLLELLRCLVVYFNYFLSVDKLCITTISDNVYVSYNNKEKVLMNNYLINQDDIILIIQRRAKNSNKYRYIDYFRGKYSIPNEIEL